MNKRRFFIIKICQIIASIAGCVICFWMISSGKNVTGDMEIGIGITGLAGIVFGIISIGGIIQIIAGPNNQRWN